MTRPALSLLAEFERMSNGPLPPHVLAAIAAANRFARLSPRTLIVSELAGWQHEIEDRRTLLKLLSEKIAQDRAYLPSVPEEHRAYRAGCLESTVDMWRMHAWLMVNAARQARRCRKELAALRPALIGGYGTREVESEETPE
jgi:hypothetical protein